MVHFDPVQRSYFSLLDKIKLRVWLGINISIFRYTPYFSHRWRITLLKIFGAKVSWSARISRLAIIEQPWNLEVGHLSSIGDGVWILCREKVSIGEKTVIGRNVGITSGSHDITSTKFIAVNKPVSIGNNVWIINESYVLPGVCVDDGAVVAAKSLVNKNVDKYQVVGGNPIKLIQMRNFN